jgi:Caspase domain/Sulfatase-modifying factor enzyme 1
VPFSHDFIEFPWRSDRRLALVIGNSAYSSAPLKNPKNDAASVSRTLQMLGFEIVGGEHRGCDLGYSQFAPIIREFSRELKAAPDAAALLFFAGHAIQLAGRNYLIPVDAIVTDETDVATELFDLQYIIDAMEASKRVSIVLIDACRRNPFAVPRPSREPHRHVARMTGEASGLAVTNVRGGTIIAYATGPGQIAYDGDGPNSYFTEALMAHITKPGRELELALKDVREQVYARTVKKQSGPQIPWVHSAMLGSFYFSPPTVVADHGADSRSSTSKNVPIRIEFGQNRYRLLLPGSGRNHWIRDAEFTPKLILLPRQESGATSQDGLDLAEGGSKELLIGKFPVTVSEFSRFVQETSYPIPQDMWTFEGSILKTWKLRDNRSYANPGFSQSGDHPVVGVSLRDATAYIRWLSEITGYDYTLPTLEDWQYSVGNWNWRVTGIRYIEFADRDEQDGTLAADSIEAGTWGIFKQPGRLWEWCSDTWKGPDETSGMSFSKCVDQLRSLRGGVLTIHELGLVNACRTLEGANWRASVVGFRVKRNLCRRD